MKTVQKAISFLCITVLLLCMTACGTSKTSESSSNEIQSSPENESMQKDETVATEDTEKQDTINNSPTESDSKILVAYFSATGNTKSIAETIAELTDAELFEIIPAEPYIAEDLNYNDDNCRANKEQNDKTVRPEISEMVENMEQYDVVLIGHPIWWGEEPCIIDTFMESYDFSGKTVVNFCTSGSSGIGMATKNMQELSPNANWLEGHRFETGASSPDVQEWLNELNILN